MLKKKLLIPLFAAAFLAAAVVVLSGPPVFAKLEPQITVTGVPTSALPGTSPTPVYAITDEATGMPYELTSTVVDLDNYVGQRVTISGDVEASPPARPPLLKVTQVSEPLPPKEKKEEKKEEKKKAEEAKKIEEKVKKGEEEPKNAEEAKKTAEEAKKGEEKVKKGEEKVKKGEEEPKNAEEAKKKAEQEKQKAAQQEAAREEKESSSLEKVAERLRELVRSSIAFNTPEEMQVGKTETIELLLSTSYSAEELKEQLTEAGEKEGVEGIPTAERMQARLTGDPGFEIQAITPEEQAISSEDTTKWSWDVTPTQAGKDEKLHLTITALIEVAEGTAPRTIDTYNRTMVVKEVQKSWGQRV